MRGSISCKFCDFPCDTVETYYEHYLSKHVQVPCNYCSFFATTLASLQIHISRVHGAEREEDAKKCRISSAAPVTPTVSSPSVYSEVMSAIHSSSVSSVSAEVFPSLPPSELIGSFAVDLYPPYAVKLAVLKFYLTLEGLKSLPSTTVQIISENIARLSEMSHHCLKRTLKIEMMRARVEVNTIDLIISKVFISDPVFNVHHKEFDLDLVTSIHLRKKYLKSEFIFVPSIEIFLGQDTSGKRKVSHYVPVRASLEAALKDLKVKAEIKKSFLATSRSSDSDDIILEDYTDGSAFQDHRKIHTKCIQLIFFQDAFEFSPFGPASGLYKSLGIYFYIGNLPPEFRSKVKTIFLAQLLQEALLKPSEEEVLKGVNKFKEALARLIKDLNDLEVYGLEIDGEVIPVCFLFCLGDNLGSHQIGSFVQGFTAEFFCRYCPISSAEFKAQPHVTKNLRTPEEYDQCVVEAKANWNALKEKSIDFHKRKKLRQREQGLKVSTSSVSKSSLKKLQSLNYMGVKSLPSALNSILGFHVCKPGLPPCLAHDLFSGVVDLDLAKILENLIQNKGWFTLETLNRRIKSFKYKGTDAADAPNALRSFDGIKGHACETWTLLRLLPLIICDLIKDENDEMWKLLLLLKEICEYVCAPKIKKKQVAYMHSLIELYLCEVKRLLPECLTPKHHYLLHYAWLILVFGPLIRLFTLRFESKHVFFKTVGKACRCFKNITLTLAQKYQYRFAYDNIEGLLPNDVEFKDFETLKPQCLPEDIYATLAGSKFEDIKTVFDVKCKGITYKVNMWMLLHGIEPNDLCLGCIEKILIFPNDDIHLIVRHHVATQSYKGFYIIGNSSTQLSIQRLDDLPDYYPLPSYYVEGQSCLSLKHSAIFM